MKAKRISTGEEVEVSKLTFTNMKTNVVCRRDKKNGGFIAESDLEFLPDTSEEVIEGWICKNEYDDGFARIHAEEPSPYLDELPITGEQIGVWRSNGNIYLISDELFPNLKWTDSPKRVKITLTPMEE